MYVRDFLKCSTIDTLVCIKSGDGRCYALDTADVLYNHFDDTYLNLTILSVYAESYSALGNATGITIEVLPVKNTLYKVPVEQNEIAIRSRHDRVVRTINEYQKSKIEVDSDYIFNLQLLKKELENVIKVFQHSDGKTCCVSLDQLSLINQTIENEKLRRVVIN